MFSLFQLLNLSVRTLLYTVQSTVYFENLARLNKRSLYDKPTLLTARYDDTRFSRMLRSRPSAHTCRPAPPPLTFGLVIQPVTSMTVCHCTSRGASADLSPLSLCAASASDVPTCCLVRGGATGDVRPQPAAWPSRCCVHRLQDEWRSAADASGSGRMRRD